MKKVILFLVLCIGFAFSTSAQVVLPETGAGSYINEYAGIATDTVGAGTTIWNRAYQLNKPDGLFYNASVKVSDVTAGATCTVILQGKYFATDAYTTITTMTWAGGGTDTTVTFIGNTTKVYYRYLNFKVTRTANKAKVTWVKLSVKK